VLFSLDIAETALYVGVLNWWELYFRVVFTVVFLLQLATFVYVLEIHSNSLASLDKRIAVIEALLSKGAR